MWQVEELPSFSENAPHCITPLENTEKLLLYFLSLFSVPIRKHMYYLQDHIITKDFMETKTYTTRAMTQRNNKYKINTNKNAPRARLINMWYPIARKDGCTPGYVVRHILKTIDRTVRPKTHKYANRAFLYQLKSTGAKRRPRQKNATPIPRPTVQPQMNRRWNIDTQHPKQKYDRARKQNPRNNYMQNRPQAQKHRTARKRNKPGKQN